MYIKNMVKRKTLVKIWGMTPVYFDNTVVICLSKNPIIRSRAKHIKIKLYFIRDYVQKGVIDIKFIDTDHQWTYIFLKPLIVERLDFIKKNLYIHFISY